MAGRIPKHPEERVRKSGPKMTVLPERPNVKIPRLPKDEEWTDVGRSYWRTLWTSPMAAVYVDADVTALVRLTRLVQLSYAENLRGDVLAEIRQLEDRFGLSPLSRRRLMFEIDRATTGVTSNTADPPEDDERWLRVVDSA